jgi:hypothetical protein
MHHNIFLHSYNLLGDFLRKVKVFLLNGILLTCTSLLLRSIGMVFGVYISNKIGTEAVRSLSTHYVCIHAFYNTCKFRS